ncbi:MAG: FeoC-like transcriptional regulator [Coxiella endosymbiont of Dermacentor nuttalli]
MLLSLKSFLRERKTANLQELSLHFCKQPQIIRSMLEHWIKKGKICRLGRPADCETRCQICHSQFTEIYKWIDEQT